MAPVTLDIMCRNIPVAPNSPYHTLVLNAYQYLLGHPRVMEHLSRMTLASSTANIDEEDIEERKQDIIKYLDQHFPTVTLKTLRRAHGSTPMPETFFGYCHPESEPTPFLSRSTSAERQNWRLHFYLDMKTCDIFTNARTAKARSIISFFLHITIIRELSHVIMLVFSSEPTPTKFRGYRSPKNNPAGLNHEGHEVERGEAGDSMVSIITGGDVMLLFGADQDIHNCDPDMVDVAVIGRDQMQLIGDSPHVSEIATGMWHHISALAFRAIPSRVAKMHMKISHNNDQSPPSSPGSSNSPDTPPEEDCEMLVIDPDVVLVSGTHQDDSDSLRIARMVVAARKATGRLDLVAAVSDSSGLGPGEKR